jgi:hypothetical protein
MGQLPAKLPMKFLFDFTHATVHVRGRPTSIVEKHMPAATENPAVRRKRRRASPDPAAFAFTIPDAQAMGAPGRTSIYKLAKQGRLKLLRVAGRTLVDGDSLRTLLRGSPAPADLKAATA